MSNLATVQALYEAFGAGDVPGFLDMLAEDVEWEQWPPRPGVREWLIASLRGLPLRRDRTGDLAGEPTGRWDRLDLLVVVLLVIGSFTLRTFNLGRPFDMYFDEVYHARTATEFLQDWQYGMPHMIYEYTHPHLAKYAIALGIQAFGDNHVIGVTQLPPGAESAATEVRWSPDDAPAERDGDRLYVADGTEVQVYDLASREAITTIGMPSDLADAVAIDSQTHTLVIAAADGSIYTVDTTALDALRRDDNAPGPEVQPLADLTDLGGSIQKLAVVDGTILALADSGTVAAVDESTGAETGLESLDGASAVVGLPPTQQVVADPTAVKNAAAEARIVAGDLSDEATRIEPLLKGSQSVSLAGYLTEKQITSVKGHIDDGSLPGITLETRSTAAIADSAGMTVIDPVTVQTLDEVTLDQPATGIDFVSSGLDQPTLYIASGKQLVTIAVNQEGNFAQVRWPMPGRVTDVLWNQPAGLVHLVGTAPDGSPTIYVVEPHGNAVFADAKLPFVPAATVMDTQPDRPGDDRTQILALSGEGSLATVDIGSNAFGWRLPGVIMGVVTIVGLYLLARLLFRRRSVALITAVLVLAGGMFFANSRIAMNDSYVTGFIVAAATLFAPLYLGIWKRPWQVVLGLAGVGLLLGLALASKWVGAYAIGGIALLVLLRSALGRMLALAALVAVTGVLGALAIRPAAVAEPHRNWLFLIMMAGFSIALAVAMVRRPVRFTRDELRFAVVAPAVVGALLVVAGFTVASHGAGFISAGQLRLAGAAFLVVGGLAYPVAWIAGRRGLGPLAAPRPVLPDEPRASPAPTGWLRPGAFGGIPWIYALLCLSIVPLGIYVASYIPWALNSGGPAGSPILFPPGTPIIGLWPPSHNGQTFVDLQISMYDYHNNLRATHAASSPWWAWPLDLKPVWFYQHGFGNGTTGVIYDSGNVVEFWLAIPAVAWAAWMAWRRRSLSLTLIVLMFFCLWLPWERIDRATFQYHVFSSLPFAMLAFAYFIAELWHGPSNAVWVVARVSAAAAILAAPLLWVARRPLCAIAGTESVHPDGIACGAIVRSTTFSEAALVSVLIIFAGFAVLAWQLWQASRPSGSRFVIALPGNRRVRASSDAAIFGTLVLTLLGIAVALNVFSQTAAFTLTVQADEIAIVGLVLLAVPAWLVFRARDSRRFALGILVAAIVWFVAWYPNLSGLPLPDSVANVYQGLLPTWNYDFQFTVNLDPPIAGAMIDLTSWVVMGLTALLVLAALLVARAWHRRPPRREEAGAVSEPA